MLITRAQHFVVVGALAFAIGARKKVNALEIAATELLKEIGARDGNEYNTVLAQVQEAVYNEGDDAEAATKTLLERLGLEVADA